MGKTITEKILSRAAGKDVSPGDYIEVTSRMPYNLGILPRGMKQMNLVGTRKVFNPEMMRIVDGHFGSTASHHAGELRSNSRTWAKEIGIPQENIFDLGRGGVEHIIASENGWALPGEIYFSDVNGHTTTLGALGGFCITLSYGSGAYMITGKTWIRVPESVKIIVNGKLPHGITGRDVSEYVLGSIGPSSAVGKVIEWTGSAISEMNMADRFSICCNALFFGAWTAIMNPDQKTLDYVNANSPLINYEPVYSDEDAQYCKTYEFDISELGPQIVPPPERYIVRNVSELEGTPINCGFIGTCENGRIEDMRSAAQILKGRKILSGVVLNITPGTSKVFKQCVQEGLMEIFLDAEAAVHLPNCGQCFGANTPLGSGDVCIATGTCNYPGRMGSKEAEIYLASPATVAASCVEGKIADLRKYY